MNIQTLRRRRVLEPSKKPLNVLLRCVNNNVIVKLKNGIKYKGKMTQTDSYMNLVLKGAVEFHGEDQIANYGNIFIRGNNILYICIDAGKT